MKKTAAQRLSTSLVVVAAALTALLVACADEQATAPEPQQTSPEFSLHSVENGRALATLVRTTARYHDLNKAIADGFVFLHGCENRPDEGPVGTVYVHPARLMDGRIDPHAVDALIYEPARGGRGRPRLVGVEFAVPYSLWPEPQPPAFLGATFQREDEFGVFGLHVWIWRFNPEGLFAESNPRVSC